VFNIDAIPIKSDVKVCKVEAIEFDWIFDSSQGIKFLKVLSETDDVSIFGVDIIVSILSFLWKCYWKWIFMFLLFPYILYFIIFSIET